MLYPKSHTRMVERNEFDSGLFSSNVLRYFIDVCNGIDTNKILLTYRKDKIEKTAILLPKFNPLWYRGTRSESKTFG